MSMDIKDFMDLSLLEEIMENWSKATGMAAIAVDNEENPITNGVGMDNEDAIDTLSFSEDIMANGEVVGTVLCGLVFDEDDEDMPPKDEDAAYASAKLLGQVASLLADNEYKRNADKSVNSSLKDQIAHTVSLVQEINEKSLQLDKIESKQKILSLNASIEAARSGEFGRGFAVVANEVGKSAAVSGEINRSIKESLKALTAAINEMDNTSSNI